MATVTLTTIQTKVEKIIKQKRNYAKNVKNYLAFMADNLMIQDFNVMQGKDYRLHITVDLWGKKRSSITFNVPKLQKEAEQEGIKSFV